MSARNLTSNQGSLAEASRGSQTSSTGKRRFARGWLAMLSLALLAGCGESVKPVPTGTVSGTVTVKGKPLEVGRLNFASGTLGTAASGTLGKDGSYSLEGPLTTGTYDVYVTFEMSPATFKSPAAGLLKTVAPKYQKQSTSKLVAIVEEGSNNHVFDLK